MYINLKEYIESNDREQRRLHLKLDEKCLEIGGDSRLFRGLLAHHLHTRMDCRHAHCCHACHNPACSNPNHLYWGTPKDNILDSIENGNFKSVHDSMKNKYSDEEISKIYSRSGRLGGLAGGHNKLRSEVVEKRLLDFRNDKVERGRNTRLSELWGVSHTTVRRFLEKYGDMV